VHAELATDYYTLEEPGAEQVLLEKTVEDYSRSLQLTQRCTARRSGGAGCRSSAGTVETARTQAADIALGTRPNRSTRSPC